MKKSSHSRRRRPGNPSPSAARSRVEGEERGENGQLLPGAVDEALVEEELGDNDLAEATIALLDRVRPYFGIVLAGIGAAVAAFLVSTLMSSQAEVTRQQSWDAAMAAMSTGDSESFNEVVRRYPGTDAARWAELLMADAAAGQGAELLFVDRQRATGRLQAAVELYSALIASRQKGLLAERAVFGLAKARECLGQLEDARSGYEAVAKEFPADGLTSLAASRAADLGRESTRQWYDWFAAQQITPPVTATNATNATDPAADPAANPAANPAATPSEPAPVE
ncbi:MAG: hypothetical protein WCQ77_09430 [Planctomycetota bacterium]